MRARTKSVSLGTRTPSTLLRRVRRAAAAGSGWYPISAAIVRMRAAVAAPTPGEPGASARETVDTCTAARDATAARVTGGAGRAWGGGVTRHLYAMGSGGAGADDDRSRTDPCHPTIVCLTSAQSFASIVNDTTPGGPLCRAPD